MAITTRTKTLVLVAAAVVTVGVVAATQVERQNSQPTESRPTGPNPDNTPTVEAVQGNIDADTFRRIAQLQMPTVVSIRTMTETTDRTMDFGSMERFHGLFDWPEQPPRLMEGAGSGFIIDASGLVLTNHHVVEDAREIEVTLFSDPEGNRDAVKRFKATVLGRDALTDSALLQLNGAKDLPVAKLGNSDSVRPGDWVVAIGNPFALSHTVTMGIISATSRPFPVEGRQQRVLQTDAAVNPGNSGGPLLNLRGEVIGINTAIMSARSGANVGVGFAVPLNLVRNLLTDLRKGDIRHGRLGVEIRSIPPAARAALGAPDAGGALVVTLESGGPADKAGLEPGDVIISFNGEVIDDPDELVGLVSNTSPGASANVGIIRDQKRTDLTVTIGELTIAGMTSGPSAESPNGLGLTLTTINPEVARQRGLGASSVVVSEVERGSPAEQAGMRPGDVVLEINRSPVNDLENAARRLRGIPTGGTAFVLVARGNQRMFLVINKPG